MVVVVADILAMERMKTRSKVLRDELSPFFLNSSSLLKTLTTTTISSIMSSFTLETPSLSNLPSELLFQVLMNLDAQSLCRLRTTCKDFYKCPDEMGFWKHFVLKEWCLEASGSFL